MQSRRSFLSSIQFPSILIAAFLLTNAAWGTSGKIVYSFTGGSDGEYLDTELVRDSAGNLYGTSVQGGTFKSGTVFQVTPDGIHTVLYSFTGGADGGEPYKGVTLDAQGNLYGTAVTGGGGSCEGGCGVVFKLTRSGDVWTQTVIHAFTGADGSGPGSPVSIDKFGNVYGTTPTGGKYGMGTLYLLRPNGGTWKFYVIHTFTGGVDGGGGSAGRLLIDPKGNIYGVCTTGGLTGFGTVYEVSRANGRIQFTTLYAFQDSPDGALPYSGLVFDKSGNLYGTTYYAGANDVGTVYSLTPNNGGWTEQVLYSFQGGADGSSPISSLVSDGHGSFYGTTSADGSSCGCGTIYKMTPTASGLWTESVVYRFPGSPGLGDAYNGIVTDGAGNFYGTTVNGGTSNDGAIYEFTP
ncbi:MAG: choice-of-anchor tandem repeat GloVer-containing protein [Candidatus Sulfotelmatobacter sp.]